MSRATIDIPTSVAHTVLKVLGWTVFELEQQNQGGDPKVDQLVADCEIAIALIERRLA